MTRRRSRPSTCSSIRAGTPARSGRSSAGSSPACATASCSRCGSPTAGCSCRRPSTTRRRATTVAADGDHWIEVGPRGTVQSFTWVAEPRAGKHGLDQPVRVRARSGPTAPTPRCCTWSTADRADAIRVGSRVAPRWRGRARRLHHRHRGVGAARRRRRARRPRRCTCPPTTNSPSPASRADPARVRAHRRRRDDALSRRASARGRSSAAARAARDEVYAASRGTDPKTGEPTSIEVEVGDTGCITTFCVVNIPGLSELAPEIPYVSAQILLDGAEQHVLRPDPRDPGRGRAHGHAGEGEVGRRAESPTTRRSNGSSRAANPTPTTRSTRTTSDA